MNTVLSGSQLPQSASGRPQDYSGYITWKGWKELFSYSAEEAAYFLGETRGLAIKGADLLEIGFGAGRFLAWARDRGACVTGVEVNQELIEAASTHGVALLPGGVEDVALKYESRFDTIAAFDVLEHVTIDTVARQLASCAIMLKPGGQLLARFPNAQSPFGLPPQNGDPTHQSRLSRGVIEQLVQGTTLEVVRYGPSFRIKGGGVAKGLARRLRYCLRDAISFTLNAIYAQNIPWDPVVVIVLRKRNAGGITCLHECS